MLGGLLFLGGRTEGAAPGCALCKSVPGHVLSIGRRIVSKRRLRLRERICPMTTTPALRFLLASTLAMAMGTLPAALADDLSSGALDGRQLASQVTIYRDAYGMPHIDGKNDQATVFGFG